MDAASWNSGRHCAGWLGVLAVYALGAVVVTQDPVMGLVAGVCTATALGGSMLLIAFATTIHAAENRAARALWVRHFWLLHTPWLVAPMMAAVAIATAVLWPGPNAANYAFAALAVGASFWLIGCAVAFAAWQRRMAADAARLRLGRGIRHRVYVAGAACMLGAMLLGFLAGGASAIGAIVWAPADEATRVATSI